MGAAQSDAAKEPSEGVARHCQSEFERLCPKERDYLVLTGGRETISLRAEFGYAYQCFCVFIPSAALAKQNAQRRMLVLQQHRRAPEHIFSNTIVY